MNRKKNGVRRGAVSLALLGVLVSGTPARAGSAQPTGRQTEAAREGYVPVKDLPPAEQLPAAPLVLGAYALIWVGVLVYVWSISRRLASVDRELGALRRMVDARR
jgi:CcmD family protein